MFKAIRATWRRLTRPENITVEEITDPARIEAINRRLEEVKAIFPGGRRERFERLKATKTIRTADGGSATATLEGAIEPELAAGVLCAMLSTESEGETLARFLAQPFELCALPDDAEIDDERPVARFVWREDPAEALRPRDYGRSESEGWGGFVLDDDQGGTVLRDLLERPTHVEAFRREKAAFWRAYETAYTGTGDGDINKAWRAYLETSGRS